MDFAGKDVSATISNHIILKHSERSFGAINSCPKEVTGVGGLMIGSMDTGFEIPASYDRKRIVAQNIALNFRVTVRNNRDFRWPEPKHHETPKPWQRAYVSVGDVITDLMDPSTISQEFSHVQMNHKPLLVERYRLIPEGGRLPERDLPEHLRKGYRSHNVKNYGHVFRRLAMDRSG